MSEVLSDDMLNFAQSTATAVIEASPSPSLVRETPRGTLVGYTIGPLTALVLILPLFDVAFLCLDVQVGDIKVSVLESGRMVAERLDLHGVGHHVEMTPELAASLMSEMHGMAQLVAA